LYRHESEASFHQYNEDHLDVSGGSDILIPAQGLSFSVTLAHDKGRVYNPGTDTTEKILTFFGAPGTYFFQAKVRNRREFIISNTVAVRVSAPEGDNAEAWKLWKDPEVTAVVHERTTFFSEDERQSGLAKLRAIAARFPSTIYAGYARRRLAAVDGTPAGQDRTDSPAPSQTGAAPAAATTPPSPAPVAATEPEAPGNWYKWAGVGAVLILAVTVLIWKFRR
jgi:hypothetical protein